jgi:hypothetical protein
MRTIEYVKLFETHYRLRIRFDSDQGRVIRFLVQLERDLGGWTPIVRYDTAGAVQSFAVGEAQGGL